MNHYNYDTVTEAIAGLKQRGYCLYFEMGQDRLVCREKKVTIPTSELQIEEVYRFEGLTDPGDEMIVFAISAPRLELKGILVNGYGIYAESVEGEMVKHIKMHLH